MARMHETLCAEIRESSNSLAATIGELDDRMQRLRSGDRS
jgi:hypothetical protein